MPRTFPELCSEVTEATKFIVNYEQCCPHYQRVLDYILAHPDLRDDIAKVLCDLVENGGYHKIALVQFLMVSLKWPEIRVAAQARCNREGNMYHEVKQLVDVYE